MKIYILASVAILSVTSCSLSETSGSNSFKESLDSRRPEISLAESIQRSCGTYTRSVKPKSNAANATLDGFRERFGFTPE